MSVSILQDAMSVLFVLIIEKVYVSSVSYYSFYLTWWSFPLFVKAFVNEQISECTLFSFTCAVAFELLVVKQVTRVWHQFTRIIFFSFQVELSLSLSELQLQPPNNRTIESFVKDYVDKYVG